MCFRNLAQSFFYRSPTSKVFYLQKEREKKRGLDRKLLQVLSEDVVERLFIVSTRSVVENETNLHETTSNSKSTVRISLKPALCTLSE